MSPMFVCAHMPGRMTFARKNALMIMPRLNPAYGVKTEIWAALAAGREVTVSQSNITHAGQSEADKYRGCGYIIFDPNTGAGAYKISGGLNGAFCYFFWIVGMMILCLAIFLGGVAIMSLLALFIIAAPLVAALVATILGGLCYAHATMSSSVAGQLGLTTRAVSYEGIRYFAALSNTVGALASALIFFGSFGTRICGS